jgi:hypothetical protein
MGARYNQLISKVAEQLLSDPVGTIEQLEGHRNGYKIFSDVVDFIDERRVASGNIHVDAGWSNVKNWGKNKLDKAKNWGKGKMQDAWNGIKSAPGKAVDAVTPQWMSDIWNYQDPNALPAPAQTAAPDQYGVTPNQNTLDWTQPQAPAAAPAPAQPTQFQQMQPIPLDQRNPKKEKTKGITPNYPANYDPSAQLPQTTSAPSRPIAPPPSATAPAVPNPATPKATDPMADFRSQFQQSPTNLPPAFQGMPAAPAAPSAAPPGVPAPQSEQFSPKTMEDWFSGLDDDYNAQGAPSSNPAAPPATPAAPGQAYDPNADIQDALGLSPYEAPTPYYDQGDYKPKYDPEALGDPDFSGANSNALGEMEWQQQLDEIRNNPPGQPQSGDPTATQPATPEEGSPEETEAWANGISEEYGPQQEVPGIPTESPEAPTDESFQMAPEEIPGVTPESQQQLQTDEQQIRPDEQQPELPFGNAKARKREELIQTRDEIIKRGSRRLLKVRGY